MRTLARIFVGAGLNFAALTALRDALQPECEHDWVTQHPGGPSDDFCRKCYALQPESIIERKAREQRESPRGAPPTVLPDPELGSPPVPGAPTAQDVVPYPICACGHRYDHHRHHAPEGCYRCKGCRGYAPPEGATAP